MNGEQQHEREEEKRHYRKDQPDDEIDVLAREFWKWLQKQSIDLSQWITAIATAMLVIVTLFYTIYAAKQAKSTETAARAAKLAADTSKDALIASNRPWLGLDGSVTLDILDKTPVVKLAGHYAIKNFGQGPAIRYETLSEPFWSPHNSDYLVFGKSACAIPIQFVTEANRRDPKIRDLGPIGSILFPEKYIPKE